MRSSPARICNEIRLVDRGKSVFPAVFVDNFLCMQALYVPPLTRLLVIELIQMISLVKRMDVPNQSTDHVNIVQPASSFISTRIGHHRLILSSWNKICIQFWILKEFWSTEASFSSSSTNSHIRFNRLKIVGKTVRIINAINVNDEKRQMKWQKNIFPENATKVTINHLKFLR